MLNLISNVEICLRQVLIPTYILIVIHVVFNFYECSSLGEYELTGRDRTNKEINSFITP